MLGIDQEHSEFEEAYYDEPSQDLEIFKGETLSETIEVLGLKAPICVSPGAKVGEVIAGMAERNHGCVLVKDGEVLVGIFTERDVIRRVIGKVDPDRTEIRAVMTPDPEAISFHDTIAHALNKMTVGGFRHVPLVDIKRAPVGVVSVKDLIEFIVSHFPNHVLNVSPDPSIRNPDQIAGAG